jgi:hypothetical protein
MEILTSKITVAALKSMAENMFGNVVKAVVHVRYRFRGVEEADMGKNWSEAH